MRMRHDEVEAILGKERKNQCGLSIKKNIYPMEWLLNKNVVLPL